MWSGCFSLAYSEHGSGREACDEEALLVARPGHVFGVRVGGLGAAPAGHCGRGAGESSRASGTIPGNFGTFRGVLER